MPHSPLSDEDWAKIAHLFPSGPVNSVGRPRSDPRAIVDAIFWVMETGAKWHHLPAHYPPTQTCYIKWLEWKKTGLMSKIMQELDVNAS
ncbi:transposase [Paraburkholderia sediminicola]|uniref:transposase n=1 Tax=Paraburkholderia sediminicola TaxID=458836 RepID=UPI0038B89F98